MIGPAIGAAFGRDKPLNAVLISRGAFPIAAHDSNSVRQVRACVTR